MGEYESELPHISSSGGLEDRAAMFINNLH